MGMESRVNSSDFDTESQYETGHLLQLGTREHTVSTPRGSLLADPRAAGCTSPRSSLLAETKPSWVSRLAWIVGVPTLLLATAAWFWLRPSHQKKTHGHVTMLTADMDWQLITFGPNTICRLDAQDLTSDGRGTAKVVHAETQQECMQKCEEVGQTCKGMEYSLGRCELWTKPVGYVQHKVGFGCAARVPRGTFNSTSSRACRRDKSDTTSDGGGTVRVVGFQTEDTCNILCRTNFGTNCTGTEFYKGRCEMWHIPIKYIDPRPDYTCSVFTLTTHMSHSVYAAHMDPAAHVATETTTAATTAPRTTASTTDRTHKAHTSASTTPSTTSRTRGGAHAKADEPHKETDEELTADDLREADKVPGWKEVEEPADVEPTPKSQQINPVLALSKDVWGSVTAWEGWGVMFPFLVTSTTTTTTTTSSTTTTTTSTTITRTGTSSTTTTTTSSSTSRTTTSTTTTTTETTTTETSTTTTTTKCQTANEGDTCYKKVVAAMTHDVFEDYKKYKGLNRWSSFEDFQTHLNKEGEDCRLPCECHTAVIGEDCYDEVLRLANHELPEHPDWYPELHPNSRFEEIQARLHRDNKGNCEKPCTPTPWTSPSLFCFSITRPEGVEREIMKEQISMPSGIFGCDGHVVLSTAEPFLIAEGPMGKVHTVHFPMAEVGKTSDGTAGNALLFMQAFEKIKEKTTYFQYDWVIKADPDAVVLADRLKLHLRKFTGKKAYVKNCDLFHNAKGWPKVYGAIEAFSVSAMQEYFKGLHRCKNELDWKTWGEDIFMMHCLDHLGVGSVVDLTLAYDARCNWKGEVDCGNGNSAAFHPFKSKKDWVDCWNKATKR